MRTVTVVTGLSLACALAWGQATSQISGTVSDQTGLAVPGAEVKATQTATGAVRTVTSGADGGYVLANLPIGPYLLEVTKQGFNRHVQSGVVLQVDSNPTIDIALKVGAVSEQVTVEAAASQVEEHSTGIGQVVDNQRVSEMPLNGRNPIELVFLAGMSSSPGNGAINTVRNYPTVVVSVAGGQGNGVGYQLDGTIYQDPYNNLALPIPFPDALQEFKVETSTVAAQYGYHSGATVSAATKSGTNEFHGDLFEFLRNGDLNARDYFAVARDTLKRNQFGGVIGGRIIKDKLFFFGGYQRTVQRSAPAFNSGYVPTAAMLGGDFSAFASSACQGRNVTLSAAQGFVNNQIAPTKLNGVALNLAKTLPTPIDQCGTVKYGFVTNQNEDLPVGRLDWQASSKHSVFGRFSAGNLNVPSTYDGKNPLTINTFGVHDFDYQLALGDTYLLTSNLVSSLRISASRANVQKVPDNFASLADFGANYAPVGGKVLQMSITGGLGFNLGTAASVPGESHDGPNPSIAEDLSWVKGSHQFGFGGNIYRQGMNYWSGLNAVGNTTYDGTVTGLGMADFLTGNVRTFSQGTPYGFYTRQYYASLYAQDSWKVTRRLTLNYGLRWEPYLSIYSKWGQIHFVDFNLFAQNYHSPVYPNAPAGVIFPGDPHYPCGKSYNCDKWADFFPRVGLAFDPKGDGKMTVRLSYGMSGDRTHMFFPNQMSFGPPFGDTISLSNVNLTNPWATFNGVPGFTAAGQNPIPSLVSVAGVGNAVKNAPFPTAGFYVNNPNSDFKQMYVNQWNLSVQRQMGTWLLTANYLGNSTIHMNTSTTANPAVFLGLGPCTLNVVQANGSVASQNYPTCSTTANQNFRRVLYLQNPSQGQYFANIAQSLNGGTASYEALYLSANKALSHGVSVLMNYTWSHCIGDVYDQQPSGNGSSPPDNRRAYRGNCTVGAADVRHFFVLNMVATMPKFGNKALRMFASDWQIAPILQLKSGYFMTITSGTDQALTTVAGQTGNQVSSNVFAATRAASCSTFCIGYLNKAAFLVPAPGTYGNMAYGTVQGPGLIQLNLALSRTFRLQERRSIQLRAEAFNLPNHLNPSNPTSSLNSALFGIINTDQSGIAGQISGVTSGDYRVVQVAAKFVF
jgi:Carboxypeptidase regulatory-like domain/TonB dependent receptor